MRDEPLERRSTMVGVRADDLAVVVAIVREAVRLNDGPIGEIAKHDVGGVLDAVFPLRAVAATERQVAAATDRVPAKVVLRFEQ